MDDGRKELMVMVSNRCCITYLRGYLNAFSYTGCRDHTKPFVCVCVCVIIYVRVCVSWCT